MLVSLVSAFQYVLRFYILNRQIRFIHDDAEHQLRTLRIFIEKRRHVRIIDWRWRLITAFWQRIPRFIWRHLPLVRNLRLSKNNP